MIWLFGAAIAACAGGARVGAFCILNARWPDGRVPISYNFPASGPLSNGTNDWETNAEGAMSAWSAVSSAFRFEIAGDSGAGINNRDGVNNMIFAGTVDGNPFEDEVLALTFTRTNRNGESIESDVVFNSGVRWNAYNGPIRVDRDAVAIFDFRRVALHELGHVLGLGHPDGTCGQFVESIMNARTTDTDELANDDRNGLSFLYAAGNQAPSADAGDDQSGIDSDLFLLDGSGSRDADGVVTEFEWEVDGEFVGAGPMIQVELNFGTHVASLTVFDDDGASDTDTIIIEVGFVPPAESGTNLPPMAVAGFDQVVAVGETVLLDGSASLDSDGTIERFVWSEGSTILGRNSIVPASLSVGTHEIVLTVFDDAGAADSDQVTISVVRGDAFDSGPVIDSSSVENAPRMPLGCGPIGLMTIVGMGIFSWVARLNRVGDY